MLLFLNFLHFWGAVVPQLHRSSVHGRLLERLSPLSSTHSATEPAGGCHEPKAALSATATRKTRTSLPDTSTVAPECLSPCCSWISSLFLPHESCQDTLPWQAEQQPPPDRRCVSCVKSSLKQPLCDLDADLICHCTLSLSSILAFLQSVLKKSARYLFLHSQPIEWPWQ